MAQGDTLTGDPPAYTPYQGLFTGMKRGNARVRPADDTAVDSGATAIIPGLKGNQRKMSVTELAQRLKQEARDQRRNSTPEIERERLQVLIGLHDMLHPSPPALDPDVTPPTAPKIDWVRILGDMPNLTWGLACEAFWIMLDVLQSEPDAWVPELDSWAAVAIPLLPKPNAREVAELFLIAKTVFAPALPIDVDSIHVVYNDAFMTLAQQLRAAIIAADPDGRYTLEVTVLPFEYPDNKSETSGAPASAAAMSDASPSRALRA